MVGGVGSLVRTAALGGAAVLLAVALLAGSEAGNGKAGSDLPGGAATSLRAPDGNAFSHSSSTLPFEKELDFKIGNGLFKKLWVTAPSSTRSSDGLGPLYNARACQRCHLKDGRGHPPSANWPEDNAVSLLIRLGIPEAEGTARPDPVYGGQLQDFAIAGIAVEGRPHVEWAEEEVTLADGTVVGLRRPAWSVADLGYGPMDPETRLSPRIASPMIGLGLLEAVPAETIRGWADPEDADGDGISGRAADVLDLETGGETLGRFGWKASQPTLRQQAAAAFSGDIGLSTSLLDDSAGDCTPGQESCRAAPDGAGRSGYEISDQMLDLVTFYSRHLAVPARRNAAAPEVRQGEAVFSDIGCGACHRARLETAADYADPTLAGQVIWPYSDLLLHDMGEGLADGLPEGGASGVEWRTPPLWGIGLTEVVNGHSYFLHDGRARSVMEAILWHGGEAEAARKRFAALTAEDRAALIAFVNSL